MPKAKAILELISEEKDFLEKLIKKPIVEVRTYKRVKKSAY